MLHRNLNDALPRLRGNDTTLNHLDLGFDDIRDEGVIAIADALKSNTTLKKLHLGWNKIGDKGAIAIADSLKSNNSLTYLDLDSNCICDEGAIAIADALKRNASLTHLELHCICIGADGAKAFIDALTDKRTSAFLHLRNNFGKWSASVLADALNYNSTLTMLSLFKKFNIKKDIGEDLKKQIQDLLERNRKLRRKRKR